MSNNPILLEKRIGYHSNEKCKICKCIKERKLYISNDTNYLGDGMYFWTSKKDCEYWYNEKLRKDNCSNIINTIWNIEYDKDSIFDLTNDEEFEVLKKIAKRISVDDKLSLGILINTLFKTDNEIIKGLLYNYKIFRCFINYEKESNYNSKDYSSKLKNQSFNTKSREILCVKSFDIIDFVSILQKEG